MTRAPVFPLLVLSAALLLVSPVAALQPPSREQLARYRQDGTLGQRVAAARQLGNHRLKPHLVQRLSARLGLPVPVKAAAAKGLPTTGTDSIFTLLISFADEPASIDASEIDAKMYGDGDPQLQPSDSLRNFYRRSSYNQLELQGATLGWYTTTYPRSEVTETTAGREELIWEAISHYADEGHDFAPYDNDGDGVIDYFVVIWTGEVGEWASFWWGYKTRFSNGSYRVDGKTLGEYSWQWEMRQEGDIFSPNVVIHETGHALGLPDYYDYLDEVGPPGGVGGFDQMGGSADHCAFSKMMLGWLTPQVFNQGISTVSLAPLSSQPDVALVMHGDPTPDPFAEYFLMEHRRREGNDVSLPGDGILIWHVDARLSYSGDFLSDNSYTEHKLLRLMEADGLEQIEQGMGGDAGDIYQVGDRFGPETTPSSDRYDGAPTNAVVEPLSITSSSADINVDLGSGCAIFCEAQVAGTSWPGELVLLDASARLANCSGAPTVTWQPGDGTTLELATVEHTYPSQGSFAWSLQTRLGDASCPRSGSHLVCTDDRCWGWHRVERDSMGREGHITVELQDGRLLLVGGERYVTSTGSSTAMILDPTSWTWSATGPIQGYYRSAQGVLLDDGRVLVAGTYPTSDVNAEIYDPTDNRWHLTGQMIIGRYAHGVVRLDDGRVLVAGGIAWDEQGSYAPVLQAEIFDPVSEQWSPAGTTTTGRYQGILTLLGDGRVLLTGADADEVYDPATGTWTTLREGNLGYRYGHITVTLQDGRALVAGGSYAATAEVFDPGDDSWLLVGTLDARRTGSSATVLASGQVLLSGGSLDGWATADSTLMFDPDNGTWRTVAALTEPRFNHTATLLADGTVLVIGGIQNVADGNRDSRYVEDLEHYAPPDWALPRPRRPQGRVGQSGR